MKQEKTNTRIRIFVRGSFRVEAPDGTDLTPKSRKSCGLIALLSTSEKFNRTRAFVQDKLWSDRAPEQGAASLRQALTDIRRSFGVHRDLLVADRNAIWFLLSDLEVVDTQFGLDQSAELFEGLDVRDPEFNLWLSSLRANANVPGTAAETRDTSLHTPQINRAPAQAPRQVVFHAHNQTQGELGFIETALVELAVRNLREQTDVQIYYEPPAATHPDCLMAEVQCFPVGTGRFGLRASVQSVADGMVMWSGTAKLPNAPSYDQTPPELFAASTQVSNGIIRALSRPGSMPSSSVDADANILALLGMQKVFTLRANEAAQAGKLLSEAYEHRPKGVYLAWLAQLNTIEFIEGLRPKEEAADAARERINKALEADPNNSQVLTVAANCTMVFDRDAQLAGHMAKMAVRANPANAMAWWVLAHIELYNGQYEDSYATSLRGQRLAHGTHLQYWLDFQRSIAAAFCGKLDEARLLCQTTSALRPEFRAALRFSVTLHAAADDADLGARAVRKLRALESDFTPTRIVKDPDYPVSLMRRNPLYAPKKLLDLEF